MRYKVFEIVSRFQGRLSLILIMIICLVLVPISAVDAIELKAGAKCSKVGLSKISKGSRFTCVKSGKKLVWSKGQKISNSAAPNSNTKPTPSPSPKSVQPEWLQDAYKISKVSRTAPEFVVNKRLVSPNFDPKLVESLSQYQNLASTYWKAQGFNASDSVTQVFLTEKDRSWFDEKVGMNARVVDSFFEANNPGNYFNGTVIIGKIPATSYFIIYFVGTQYVASNSSQWKWRLATMATHEYQHLVQFHYTLTTPGINLQAELPCWFNEGMTSKFESAFYLQDVTEGRVLSALQDGRSTESWTISNRISRIQYIVALINKELKVNSKLQWKTSDWLEFIESNYRQDSPGCMSYRYGYHLGHILYEKFQIDFGTSGLLNLLAAIKQEKSWKIAFEQLTGMSDLKWLDEVGLPYFLSQI